MIASLVMLVVQVFSIMAGTFKCQFGDACSAGIFNNGRYV